eukprot:2160003-Prymnesium_polylepis.1
MGHDDPRSMRQRAIKYSVLLLWLLLGYCRERARGESACAASPRGPGGPARSAGGARQPTRATAASREVPRGRVVSSSHVSAKRKLAAQ